MKLFELYTRNVEEALNAVVSTGDLGEKTIETEIKEYVFTVDILNGLYSTLNAIKNGTVNHNGVWVSGYFGSGKSHFLKYIGYCLCNKGSAISRVAEAVKENDPLSGGNSRVTITEWKEVGDWFSSHSQSIRTLLFNMGESGDSNSRTGMEFLTVFWRKFNELRGYNSNNLSCAYFLERPLDKVGKFEAFKSEISKQGFDWNCDSGILIGTMLDTVLDAAKTVMPELTVDAVRKNIIDDRIPLTVKDFIADIKEWLNKQDANCRLVFCVDEISQYINDRGDLLLQLQEIVTAFHDSCGVKVWLVCTAQQDITEITTASGFAKASDQFGKIIGRFPTAVQLSASSTEYITRKRVLDKKPAAALDLGKFYDAQVNSITSQYELPAAYPIYVDRQDFIDTYPFLSCHFKLVGQVLRAFRQRNFVVQNVKDNARSVLSVTLDVARTTRNSEVGKFIALDEFFSQMFSEGLTALAFSVIQNAEALAKQYSDSDFAMRVVKILFMICHLEHRDSLVFPATIDNITSLLMTDLSTPRKPLKEKVSAVLDYLCSQSVLLRETMDNGVDRFKFYTKTEAEISRRIQEVIPSEGDLASLWENLISDRLGSSLKAKVSFYASTVSVGMDILGRHLLSHKADVNVSMCIRSGGLTLEQYMLKNADITLVYFLNDLYNADAKFREALHSYCQFDTFSKQNALESPEEKAAMEKFRDRAQKQKTTCLIPAIDKFLLSAPLLSGIAEISVSNTSSPAKRYEEALAKHLEKVYPNAKQAKDLPKSQAELSSDINSFQPPLPGTPPSDAEVTVDNTLNGMTSPQPVTAVVDYFKKSPYGWSEYATLAVLARLVAAEKREFRYNGVPNPSREVVAANLAKNTANFSIAAKAAIDKSVIDAFLAAMRKVFGSTTLLDAKPQSVELAEQSKNFLQEKIDLIIDIRSITGERPFVAPADASKAKFQSWKQIADIKTFFETVTVEADQVSGEWDGAKEVVNFVNGAQWQKYLGIIEFAADNSENAQFLDESAKSNFNHLISAKDDMKPWSNLPSWVKIQKASEEAFNKCREEKRATIESVYSGIFDELEKLAKNLGVERSAFANKETTIESKKASESLMALENAINSSEAFKAAEMNKILAAQPKPTSQSGETSVHQQSIKSVKLNVSQTIPLKDESDVDNYLKGIKSQLMAEINTGKAVIVQ